MHPDRPETRLDQQIYNLDGVNVVHLVALLVSRPVLLVSRPVWGSSRLVWAENLVAQPFDTLEIGATGIFVI